jgi:CRISPR system Cascade subunit CasA
MLTEPVLMLETSQGAASGSLPDAYALLCNGSLTGFDGLSAHQQPAWELFLYQTAALAMIASGEHQAAEDHDVWRSLADAGAWRDRLALLTPGCADTAWSVVVDDTACPAFMQPPIRSGNVDTYAHLGQTPDEIDVLVTAKDHDVKAARAAAAAPRHWAYALVTLQTMQGYSGRGNFGIARMNGGFASRPLVMVTPARDLATRFRRGVQAALQARAEILDRMDSPFSAHGAPLLWLDPWDREDGIPLAALDPLVVEICRRVRLRRDPTGRIAAWGKPSTGPRVAPSKDLKGNLGDAFTPIGIAEGAALTVGGGGFDYRLVARLLDNTLFTPCVAMQPRSDDPAEGTWLRMAVLVRGQGKTEGVHERWEFVRGTARRQDADRAKLSKAMIDDANNAKGALNLGLLNFMQGGPAKLDFKDNRPRPYLDTFESAIDGIFLPHLFARLADPESDQPANEWTGELLRLTRSIFVQAMNRLQPPGLRSERGRAFASRVFIGALRKAGLTSSSPNLEIDDDGR